MYRATFGLDWASLLALLALSFHGPQPNLPVWSRQLMGIAIGYDARKVRRVERGLQDDGTEWHKIAALRGT